MILSGASRGFSRFPYFTNFRSFIDFLSSIDFQPFIDFQPYPNRFLFLACQPQNIFLISGYDQNIPIPEYVARLDDLLNLAAVLDRDHI